MIGSLYYLYGWNKPYWHLLLRMPLAIGAMCLVVACFCETEDMGGGSRYVFRRLGEALGAACTITSAELVLSSPAFLGPLHEKALVLGLGPKTLVLLVALPFTLAAIIGFFLPHMYRTSRYVAQSSQKRGEGRAEQYELRIANAA